MKLISATVLAALATSIHAPTANACGGDVDLAPAMYLVTQHHGRTFVLLGGAVPETAKLDWWRDDMSYDRTAIAAAPALGSSLQLTLVGKKSRTIETRRQVFINPGFDARRS